MEQIKRFLRGKGFALALLACLVAAGAAGVWAVRAVRNELEKSYEELTRPEASSAPQAAVPDTDLKVEDEPWQDVTEAANSVAGVPKAESGAASSGSSSGAVSGAGSVREPSALQGSSAPASSSAAPACAQPVTGRVLNACSGDELVYNKTLGDWRTHNGVDYACAQDAAVSAPVNGKVTAVETDGRWGSVVSIEDGEGRVWRVCGTKRYDFQFQNKRGYKMTVEGLSEKFNKEYWNYAKLISGVLRYRMPIENVIKLVNSLQLESENINTWKVGVSRALKKYVVDGTEAKGQKCPNCGHESLVYQEGCLICKHCGASRCG